ncbi:Putative lumazine-binding [Chitinophaga sp. YR627]|uniref:nuclear transport factor 2 family protein n=1 Tax=Chitinophaga sp. YR627 TaxID=1881041 RepID=UPI0008EE6D7B|nr:nuclear transport factor 2 family protein [Chitinophaga sp. YR627]SFM99231.1 Putative lumazine-binding [Chitinophaga sp. YR627]
MRKLFIMALCLAGTASFAQNRNGKTSAQQLAAPNKNPNEIADYKAITAVIDGYVEGLRLGDVAKLKKAFHKDAIMYGFMGVGTLEGSVDNLYDFAAKHGPAAGITSYISIMHKTANTAMVLVELEGVSPTENSTDYLSLMYKDGEWKIISKVFHLWVK